MASTKAVKRIIKIACNAATGVGLIGAFTTDAPALAAIWGGMIYKIAKENDVEFDNETGIKVATSIIASSASFMAGAGLLTKILTWSGVATLLGLGINCAINYFYTWRLGNICDRLFHFGGLNVAFTELAPIVVKQLVPLPTISEAKELWHFIKD